MKLYILETHTEDSSGEPLPLLSLTEAGGFWRMDRLLSYRTGAQEITWITPDAAMTLLSQYNQYDPTAFAAWRSLPIVVQQEWMRKLEFGNNFFPGALIPPELEWVHEKLREASQKGG